MPALLDYSLHSHFGPLVCNFQTRNQAAGRVSGSDRDERNLVCGDEEIEHLHFKNPTF